MKNALALTILLAASPLSAVTFSFSTGAPDARMATTSRPANNFAIETETADDFVLASATLIDHATFTGLMPSGAPVTSITEVAVEIYRIFPLDSANPPSGRVPTRTNSPSDISFDGRDSTVPNLSFSVTVLSANFSATNSVVNGINPIPKQNTGGEGPVSGEEVSISVTLTTPFVLPPGHYFLVPQVLLSSGNFLWLSAPANLFTADLQTWIRDANLAPDWLRVGTDIVGGVTPPKFNGSFSISGLVIPKGDFNADGNTDLLLRNNSTGQDALWLMNGTSVQSIVDLPALPDTNYRFEGTADFDGNGRSDILLRNLATGQDALWLMNGTALSSIVDLPLLPNTSYHFEGTGDFDGDGKPDILLRNQSTGQDAVWLMNGTALSSIVDLPALPNTSYEFCGTGDFNGDGKIDIVVRNAATGQNAIWLMNGTALSSVVDLPALADTNYRIGAVGDFNGDGKPDIVWRNSATGQNAIWLMNGTALSSIVDLPLLANTSYEFGGPR